MRRVAAVAAGCAEYCCGVGRLLGEMWALAVGGGDLGEEAMGVHLQRSIQSRLKGRRHRLLSFVAVSRSESGMIVCGADW